jgi:ABC-type multidrug transport system fused ATPase/permease subunit
VKGQSAAITSGIALVVALVLYSRGTIPLGAVVLFVTYFGEASSTLWQLSWSLDAYYRYFGTIQNALDGLRGELARTGPLVPTADVPRAVALRLNHIGFTYPDNPSEQVLQDVDLEIGHGQKVGVVGHSGAGKSTLIGLMLDFYAPTQGSILINGVDVTAKDPSFVRAVSSFVPQDTTLFNRSIRENVLYARPEASEAELLEALEQAEAKDFVLNLPGGLDTLVGERGVKLSGGQRQRIAIARAILKDAPLLLLDEATSALDSVSEQSIQLALHRLMQNRTAVVIAHRLSTLKHLDSIVVLHQGHGEPVLWRARG